MSVSIRRCAIGAAALAVVGSFVLSPAAFAETSAGTGWTKVTVGNSTVTSDPLAPCHDLTLESQSTGEKITLSCGTGTPIGGGWTKVTVGKATVTSDPLAPCHDLTMVSQSTGETITLSCG